MDFFEYLSNVEPYTTAQEKTALLYTSGKDIELSTVLKKLGLTDIDSFTEYQLEMLIFKLREISVGDIVEVRYNCKKCKSHSVGQVSIPKMFRDKSHPDIHSDIRLGIFDDDMIESIIEEDYVLKDLSIEEYDKIVDSYESNNKTLFNKTQPVKCVMCGTDNLISLKPQEVISKNSLTDIYKNYTDLCFYESNGFLDVSAMLPFEREIMMALLNEKIDKENK